MAPLWLILAKATTKNCLTIFKGKVANEFLALGAIYEQFAPSLFLLTQMTSLKWGMLNPNALESGSLGNAFLFKDSDVETAQGINQQIEFIQQGGATPSYTEAQVLLKAKINLPGLDNSLRCVLCMLAVFCVVLPQGHPLVSFLHEHYGFMKAYDLGWAMYLMHVPALCGLKGVYHLQWLLLKITKYFLQFDQNIGNAWCPDPHKTIDLIQEQRQWEPNLTETFTARYNLRVFLGLHTHTPSIKSLVPSVGSMLAGLSVSGLTLPMSMGGAAKAGATAAGKVVDSRIKNTNFNKTLFGTYKTSALKAKAIRDKIKVGTIPTLPVSKLYGTKLMCLTWHTKGVCNTNCPCLSNHVVYSVDKYAPMIAWWCHNHGYSLA